MTGLHEALWRENSGVASACLSHPFVRGLSDGSLAQETFRRYVGQDAFFLRAFIRAYALAAAKSSAVETIAAFHGLMAGVLNELRLHGHYAQELDIDLGSVQPVGATRAYSDFLLRTAWECDVGHILAAMTPCMRLYAFLGTELYTFRIPSNPYDHWVAAYSDAEFEGLAAGLESMLDALASDTPSIHAAYRTAMECELAFFDATLSDG